jgi:hypothetical protein
MTGEATVRCPHCRLNAAPVCGECLTELPPSAFPDTAYSQAVKASSGRRPASTDSSPEARRRYLGLATEGTDHHMDLNQRITQAERLAELCEEEADEAAAQVRVLSSRSPDISEIEAGSQPMRSARSRPDFAAYQAALAEKQRADAARAEARSALNRLLADWDAMAEAVSLRTPPSRSALLIQRTEPDQDSYFWAD